VTSDFEVLCHSARQVLREYVGGFIESITLVAGGTYDRLDVRLVQVPQKFEVVLSLERIYYLQTAKPPQMSESFADDISVHYLANDGRAWPEDADRLVTPFRGLPELVYISLVGPTSLKVVASVLVLAKTQDLADTPERND
jgi:hypothetical protein